LAIDSEESIFGNFIAVPPYRNSLSSLFPQFGQGINTGLVSLIAALLFPFLLLEILLFGKAIYLNLP